MRRRTSSGCQIRTTLDGCARACEAASPPLRVRATRFSGARMQRTSRMSTATRKNDAKKAQGRHRALPARGRTRASDRSERHRAPQAPSRVLQLQGGRRRPGAGRIQTVSRGTCSRRIGRPALQRPAPAAPSSNGLLAHRPLIGRRSLLMSLLGPPPLALAAPPLAPTNPGR